MYNACAHLQELKLVCTSQGNEPIILVKLLGPTEEHLQHKVRT